MPYTHPDYAPHEVAALMILIRIIHEHELIHKRPMPERMLLAAANTMIRKIFKSDDPIYTLDLGTIIEDAWQRDWIHGDSGQSEADGPENWVYWIQEMHELRS